MAPPDRKSRKQLFGVNAVATRTLRLIGTPQDNLLELVFAVQAAILENWHEPNYTPIPQKRDLVHLGKDPLGSALDGLNGRHIPTRMPLENLPGP